MLRKQILAVVCMLLFRRRDVLLERRRDGQESSKRRKPQETEHDERTHQEKMRLGVEKLERQIRDEEFAVNTALHRIVAGSFGICRKCAAQIQDNRLLAIPWTTQCMECARERDKEMFVPNGNAQQGDPLNERYAGLVDDELGNAILEHLRYDGRVEIDDLQVRCEGQKVILSGALPSRDRLELLHEAIEDVFGVREIETNVRIDPEAWQRRDRTPGTVPPGRSEEETILEGEPGESEYYTSLRDGVPVNPPDRLVHESEEDLQKKGS